MKRTVIALCVLFVFAVTLVPAFAAGTAAKQPAKKVVAEKKVVCGVCPVMGVKIPDVSKAKGGKSVYKGKTYYFCCAGCKAKFDKNPEKYIKACETKKKK